MKKLLLLLAGMFILVTSCKDDAGPEYKITGTWKPIKKVQTTVIDNGQPTSETFIYETCQLESRWKFNEDLSGHVLEKDIVNTTCVTKQDKDFTYVYNKKTGDITLKYITFEDHGKVFDVAENTMNLRIETTNQNIYTSKTYTLVKQ